MPPQRSIQRGAIIALIVLLFGVAATATIDAMGWDLAWTARFYQPGGPNNGWVHARDFPLNVLYDYGEIPGLALLAMSSALYVVVLIGRAPRRYARPCMVLVLTIALGPGLLVNGILKDYWGRPRPAEISNFGGNKEFRPVWKPGGPGEGRSFTCGHCAIAFSLASGVSFYPVHPALSLVALTVGIGYGIVMGIARIAQGGHFPTDVLWSGILVLMLISLLYYALVKASIVKERQPRSISAAGMGSAKPKRGS